MSDTRQETTYKAQLLYRPEGPDDSVPWHVTLHKVGPDGTPEDGWVRNGWASTRAEAVRKAHDLHETEIAEAAEPEWIDL